MRAIKTRDAGKMSVIISKMGIKLSGQSQEEVGANFIMSLIENYHKAESEVAEFMADMIGDGMTPTKWLDLEIDQTMEYLVEFTKLKGLDSFFKLVAKVK